MNILDTEYKFNYDSGAIMYENKTDKIRVIIHTENHKIEGNIHMYENARLSDILNSDPDRNFISITEAVVSHPDTGKVIYKKDFLALNKHMVTMVLVDTASGKKTIGLSLKDGQIYLNNGQYDDAITEARKVITIAPDNAEAHFILGLALGKKNLINEALSEFETVLKFSTKSSPLNEKAKKIISQIKI